MKFTIPLTLSWLAACLLLTAPTTFAQDAIAEPPAVDPLALKIAKRATDYLADQKQFQVNVEVWEDELIDGHKLQFARTSQISLRRPDRLRVDVSEDQPKRRFYYDGKALTVVDDRAGFYGSVDAPATIDELLAAAAEKFAITFPLDDLLVSQPFGGSGAKAASGQYLGKVPLLGSSCHHVAFQHEILDWQAWIEDGPVPRIRKFVITYKEEEGSPQFTAILSAWDFVTPLADFHFDFQPMADFTKIDIVAPPAEPEADAEADVKK
jgi:hypothetical protein